LTFAGPGHPACILCSRRRPNPTPRRRVDPRWCCRCGGRQPPRCDAIGQSATRPECKTRHPVVAVNLPVVGQTADHPAFCCVWEYQQPLPARNTGSRRSLSGRRPRAGHPRPADRHGEISFSRRDRARSICPSLAGPCSARVVRCPRAGGHICLNPPRPCDEPVKIQPTCCRIPTTVKGPR